MKRLIVLMLMLGILATLSFAGEVSGETRVDVERDMVTDLNIYAIDAGVVYEAGFMGIGADVFMDTDEVLDMSAKITATTPVLVFDIEWFDAEDVEADILGIVEAGVTVKY